jgi:hypothetical protein
MKTLRTVLAAVAVLASSLALAQDPAPATAAAAPAKKLSYTDDYRISVNHDADSDGTVVFQVVTKKDAKTTDITAQIRKGTSENAISRAIKAAFKEQLGTHGYNIEGEDGENVIIEGSGGREYSLVLVSSTVKGVDVKVHHD